MRKFEKLDGPKSLGVSYSGPAIWINTALVAYIYDAAPSPGQQNVDTSRPVAVHLIPASLRAEEIGKKPLVEFEVPGDDLHPRKHVARIYVHPDVVAAISVSISSDAVSTIHLLTDEAETLAALTPIRVAGELSFVAKKLGIEPSPSY